MIDVEVRPNTYYVAKTITSDVKVDSQLKDSFFGLAAAVDVDNGPSLQHYLFKGNVISEDDVSFGSLDSIKQMYLRLYVNSTGSTNQQTAPFYDVYKLKNTVSVTEGNLTNYSATVGTPLVFSSNWDLTTPWRTESFDGTGKYFIKGPDSTLSPGIDLYYSHLTMSFGTYLAALALPEEIPTAYTYGGTGVHTSNTNMTQKIVGFVVNKASEYINDAAAASGAPVGMTNLLAPATVTVSKQANGKYSVGRNSPVTRYFYALSELGGLAFTPPRIELTAEEWMDKGATIASRNLRTSSVEYNQFEDTYLQKATSDNTMFSSLVQSPDVRDIKDQTLEGPGNDDRFTAFTYTNLEGGQTTSDGQVLTLRNFWENYTGSVSGTSSQNAANPFGYNNSRKTADCQRNFATISGIPRPWPLDKNSAGRANSTFAPEIEIKMKVKKMGEATQVYSGSSYSADDAVGLDRSFTISLSSVAPDDQDSFGTFNTKTYDDIRLTFLNKDPSTGTIDVVGYSNTSYNGSGDRSQYLKYSGVQSADRWYINDSWSDVTSSEFYTTIPFDTWVTLRIRLDMEGDQAGNADIRSYFSNATSASGTTSQLRNQFSSFYSTKLKNLWRPNLTFWVNNMRAINEVPGYDARGHINNLFTSVDTITNDDKEVVVMIDSVSFYGWSPNTNNSSLLNENIDQTPIAIGPGLARPLKPGNDDINKEGADAYYTTERAPTQSYLSFGYESPTSVSGSFLFFNNFVVGNPDSVNPIPYISGGYWATSDSYGDGKYESISGTTNWFSSLKVTNAVQNESLRIDGFTNAADRFVQKGAMHIKSKFNNWAKTGNPLHGAIVTGIEDDGKTLLVDKPQIFDVPLTTDIVVETPSDNMMGITSFPTEFYYSIYNDGTGSCGYQTTLRMDRPRDGNRIFLNRSVLRDDASSGKMINNFYPASSNTTAVQLMASPKKYWINLAISNVSSSAFGDWFNTSASGTNASFLASRAYSSVVPTSNSGSTAGTTFNEFLFNDGVYVNRHTINYMDEEGSIVDLSKDYGFGKPDDNDKGTLNSGYIRRDSVSAGVNYFDMTNYIDTVNPKPGDLFNGILKPSFSTTGVDSSYTININTKDASSNKPQLVFGLEDALPEVLNFNVSPVVDYLKQGIDIHSMTKDVSTDIQFRWQEASGDTWYRLIWVDNKLIKNKYHAANLWIPLSGNSTSVGYFTSDTDTTSTTLSGTNTPDLLGFSGYGTKLNGSTVLSYTTGDVTVGSASEFTSMVHLKPTSGSANHDAFTVSGTSGEAFRLRLDSTNKVNVIINEGAKTLQSTTVYDCDGVQPLAVVVTYKKSLDSNNLKLYVNGKLEDTADFTTNFRASGKLYIGSDGSKANKYKGFIEEITFHDKMAYIAPNKNKLRISTKGLEDTKENNESYFYQSRLFTMDFHNIRGKGKNQVSRSNAASWKVTGVN